MCVAVKQTHPPQIGDLKLLSPQAQPKIIDHRHFLPETGGSGDSFSLTEDRSVASARDRVRLMESMDP